MQPMEFDDSGNTIFAQPEQRIAFEASLRHINNSDLRKDENGHYDIAALSAKLRQQERLVTSGKGLNPYVDPDVVAPSGAPSASSQGAPAGAAKRKATPSGVQGRPQDKGAKRGKAQTRAQDEAARKRQEERAERDRVAELNTQARELGLVGRTPAVWDFNRTSDQTQHPWPVARPIVEASAFGNVEFTEYAVTFKFTNGTLAKFMVCIRCAPYTVHSLGMEYCCNCGLAITYKAFQEYMNSFDGRDEESTGAARRDEVSRLYHIRLPMVNKGSDKKKYTQYGRTGSARMTSRITAAGREGWKSHTEKYDKDFMYRIQCLTGETIVPRVLIESRPSGTYRREASYFEENPLVPIEQDFNHGATAAARLTGFEQNTQHMDRAIHLTYQRGDELRALHVQFLEAQQR